MKVKEIEWADDFGRHKKFIAMGVDGRIYSQKVTYLPHWGWGDLPEKAHNAVCAAALAKEQS